MSSSMQRIVNPPRRIQVLGIARTCACFSSARTMEEHPGRLGETSTHDIEAYTRNGRPSDSK
eukprot:1164848-Pyramimonas_sp.AAC.1